MASVLQVLLFHVKYRFIEFFVFDYDSLPIYFQSGITFPLVALDKILLIPGHPLLGSSENCLLLLLISLKQTASITDNVNSILLDYQSRKQWVMDFKIL